MGATVAIVRDGGVLLAKGYGFADVSARAPVDPARTLFRIGSVTKLFTATALMRLAHSNYGLALGGYIVERISGMSWDEPPRVRLSGGRKSRS